MHNLDQKIWQVLHRLGEQADKERLGKVTVPDNERMLAITSDTGIYFNIMLKATRAKRILEVGTSAGYSTLWFCDAIMHNISAGDHFDGSKKTIITIEANPDKVRRARKNFDEAGVSDMVEIREGIAMDVLKEMLANYQNTKNRNDGHYPAVPFDFVFLDADKENATNYFDLIFPMVRVGGIIAADNILYPEDCVPEMTKYSKYVKNRSDVESVTVPIGNGEEITIKLGP